MRAIPLITHGDDVAYRPVFYTQREVAYMRDRWDRDVRAEYRRTKRAGFFWGVAVSAVVWIIARLPW
jgi:hypothetical protein